MTILILSVLAAWRIARMIVFETGPFSAFERVRFEVAKRTTPGGWIDQGMSCPMCLGFWASLIIAILSGAPRKNLILIWLGIAGGQSVLHLLLDGDR